MTSTILNNNTWNAIHSICWVTLVCLSLSLVHFTWLIEDEIIKTIQAKNMYNSSDSREVIFTFFIIFLFYFRSFPISIIVDAGTKQKYSQVPLSLCLSSYFFFIFWKMLIEDDFGKLEFISFNLTQSKFIRRVENWWWLWYRPHKEF